MVLLAPNFNHVAISVPDAAAAVKWYTEVLGFRVLVPLSTSKPAGAKGALVTAIYGEELKEMKLAILTGGNDIGVEIFQFVDPPYDGPAERESWGPRTYTRGGFFHICITVPNVEEYQQMIVAAGGKLCGSMTEPGDGQKAAYCQDPWGNVVELLDCSIGQLFLGSTRKALREATAEK